MSALNTALWFVIHSMIYGGLCGLFLTFVPFLKLSRPKLVLFWTLNILIFGVWLLSQYSTQNWLVHTPSLQWTIALWLNACMAYVPLAFIICVIHAGLYLLKRKPKRPFLISPNPILIPFVWLLSGFGVYEAMTPPILKSFDVYLADLPDELEGFKIAQITDSHIADFVSSEELATSVEQLNKHHPDLLVMTGDLLDDNRQLDSAFQALEKTSAPLGVIGILGNHEKYHGLNEIIDKYKVESAHFPIQLLIDSHITLSYRDVEFQVTGVDYPQAPNTRRQHIDVDVFNQHMADSAARAFDGVNPTQWNLLLAHHPNTFHFISDKNASLTLAGHTHGGQVLPLGYTLGKFRYHLDYLKGWFEREHQAMFVSVGMGNVWPCRMGVPREITIFTLHRKE